MRLRVTRRRATLELVLAHGDGAPSSVIRNSVVELAGEPANGLVTSRTNGLVELLRGGVHDPTRLPL